MELGLVRTLLIDHSTFDNCSGTLGGALYVSQGPVMRNLVPSFAQQTLEIKNSHFSNNRAIRNGGSVNVQGVTADVQFTGCTFLNSTSTEGWGGSVFLQSTEQKRIHVLLIDCTFDHSVAQRGGAVFARNLQLSMSEPIFSHTYGEIDWHSVATRPEKGWRGTSLLSTLTLRLFVFPLWSGHAPVHAPPTAFIDGGAITTEVSATCTCWCRTTALLG